MAKKKLTWLLILQAWAMLWVVIGHSPLQFNEKFTQTDTFFHELAQLLYTFAYSFHMPLFIMISGYLFYKTRLIQDKWTWNKTVKDKFVRLGIPYFCFISLALIVKICVPSGMERPVEFTPQGIIMGYIYPYDGPLREMWFIGVIFIFFLLSPIYKYLLSHKWMAISTFIIAFGLYFIPVPETSDPFSMFRAMHNFIFFFTGMLIAKYELESSITSAYCIISSAIIGILSIIFNVVICTKIFLSIFFWGVAIVIDRNLTKNLFRSFRNYTYQIFLIGIFVQILVKLLFNKFYFSNSYIFFYMLCVIMGLYIPVIISKIIQRTGNKVLKTICGI